MIELKGYYNKKVLQQLYEKGEIGRLEYIVHLSEETKAGFWEYCTKNNLSQTEETAERYFNALS